MVKFGEVFFCEEVIRNPDGSPREFINRFRTAKSDVYPYLFRCTVVINFTHSSALHHALSVRIKYAQKTIFESAIQFLRSDQPPSVNQEVGILADMKDVEIPEPGKYTVEILLNEGVRHTESLSFS